MSSNCRFTVDEERYIIDAVNADNARKIHCYFEDEAKDDKRLRKRVLMVRLGEMLEKLIVNLRPMEKLPSGEEYKPQNKESLAIEWTMLETISASHLNTFDPVLSIQHKFDGKLRRQRKHTQDFTSLALFRDDVEFLLRDLYGDVDSDALDSVLWAVFRIVEQFAKFVRPDLWKEHNDAVRLDYMFGIGVPEQGSIGGSDHRRGMVAKFDLIFRACEVAREPSAFSEYTVEFANWFREQWYCNPESLLMMMGPPRSKMNTEDSFATSRWPRDADVPTIARCILRTLKYEPHTDDTTPLRRALETLIDHELATASY